MSNRTVCIKIIAFFESNGHWMHRNIGKINDLVHGNSEDEESDVEESKDSGYCSDEECEYESMVTVTYVEVPLEFDDSEMDVELKRENFDWESLLPKATESTGSGYCTNADNIYDLGRHETRYTIISVKKVARYD